MILLDKEYLMTLEGKTYADNLEKMKPGDVEVFLYSHENSLYVEISRYRGRHKSEGKKIKSKSFREKGIITVKRLV